ncbi:MAG: homoserine O-acetyltransferase [Verrucomicrobia bacterium]|nr:homoserine O-acetyltransferase [Verrucomicrobiota bacterium]MBU1908676.1 homoserine O-acetyltransferase [Verrucomicrobiota bacterium]
MIVKTQHAKFDRALKLQSGAVLEPPITLAYETYGTLNADRSNAILILHALSGDAHVAGRHGPDDKKPGWWDEAVGPGRAFDTDRYFFICSNIIGGCQGSTGPSSLNPKTGNPYGLTFPVLTIADMVEAQRLLLDHLGIETLLSLVGGSMGGMQVLQWTISYPKSVRSAIVLAATAQVSPQSIAFNEVARQAIYADPKWKRGDYSDGEAPNDGLSVARMIGHITYLSDTSMREKFGRRLQERQKYGFDFATEFAVESYLKHQGDHFTRRFDANSFLYITKAIDYFDLSLGRASLAEAFRDVTARFLVVSYSSDWLYPPEQSEELVRALLQNGIDVTYVEIRSDYGHDGFLLEVDRLSGLSRDFLARVAAAKPL